jgi:hypothetical protein
VVVAVTGQALLVVRERGIDEKVDRALCPLEGPRSGQRRQGVATIAVLDNGRCALIDRLQHPQHCAVRIDEPAEELLPAIDAGDGECPITKGRREPHVDLQGLDAIEQAAHLWRRSVCKAHRRRLIMGTE